MILYLCPVCGQWRDMSIAEVFRNTVNAFSKTLNPSAAIEIPIEDVLCPDGHGAMRSVQSSDRLSLKNEYSTFPLSPPLQGEESDVLSKDGVKLSLQTLANKYKEKAGETKASAHQHADAQTAAGQMMLASRYEAQSDAIFKVASWLGIQLGKKDE